MPIARSLLLLCVLGGACHNTRGDRPPSKADVNSGADGNRAGATAIKPNRGYNDRVDIGDSDMTDWKSIELSGHPGPLEVDLHWDNNAADLAVDAFDAKGTQIASSPINNGSPQKRLIVPIDSAGTYYLRITALTPKAGSDYTVTARFETVEPPPPPPPVEHARPRPPAPVEHHEARPRKRGPGSPESGLQGRIVSARREGEGMVLYIDKGRAAGVAEGQNGWILEGASGASPLDGGTFSVTSVVDDSRSIGKTGLRSIGRNNRVSINTGK
jgi:hypothetical protein